MCTVHVIWNCPSTHACVHSYCTEDTRYLHVDRLASSPLEVWRTSYFLSMQASLDATRYSTCIHIRHPAVQYQQASPRYYTQYLIGLIGHPTLPVADYPFCLGSR